MEVRVRFILLLFLLCSQPSHQISSIVYPVRPNLNLFEALVLSCFPLSDCSLAIDVHRFPFTPPFFGLIGYTALTLYLCVFTPTLFLSIFLDVHSMVILARPCMYFSCTNIPVALVFIYSTGSARSRSIIPPSACHVLNPMRRLSRIPPVIPPPLPPHSGHSCIISRPLSSFEASNAKEWLHPPLLDHVPRFDWRLRVPSPKPPFSTIQKALAKRTQPPLPTDAYPYNTHIQKYKDQYVTHWVPSVPIYRSPRPVFSPFYHPSVRKTRLLSKNASQAGA